MTVDNNIHQKDKKSSEAQLRASAKYQAKTYKNRTICIKLKDLQTIDDFLKVAIRVQHSIFIAV